MNPTDSNAEWIEADGLGGFASGTVSGIRSRRYHALLLTATTPPAGRMVLVNGFDAWVETPDGTVALSSQRYEPDVIHPDGAARIESFEYEPWPRWRYKIDNDTIIEQELFVPKDESAVFVSWRVVGGIGDAGEPGSPTPATADITLKVRPFLSGRDFHSTHHENGGFRFDADQNGEGVTFRSYDGVPAVMAHSNGRYAHEPAWYRNFLYSEEQARGLDAVEDLASPGVFEFSLSHKPAVLMLAAEGHATTHIESIEARYAQVRTIEQARRKYFSGPLERAADAYLVKRGKGKTLIAGYPWFGDWGRDTFIAIRGLCIATGHLEDARDILLAWAGVVSQGMLPNRFPDSGEQPEFNSVDASLWYIIAVNDYLLAAEKQPSLTDDCPCTSFESKFWNEHVGYLADVIDCDHQPGVIDLTFRPNQIFAVGGLPLMLLSKEKARRVVDAVEMLLLTPIGLRSLAPGEPGYAPHYQGDSRARDSVYHQGTAWPWLIGAFVEAWVRVRGNTEAAKQEARARFLEPLDRHLGEAGLGHISEICDAESPHTPRGCPFQAWSLGERLRLELSVL